VKRQNNTCIFTYLVHILIGMINFSKILVFTFLLISVLKFNAQGQIHPEVQKLIPGNLIDQNFNQVNSENLEGKIIGTLLLSRLVSSMQDFQPYPQGI
jgi:ABC-type glycerol-3-phosphate transport system permease component